MQTPLRAATALTGLGVLLAGCGTQHSGPRPSASRHHHVQQHHAAHHASQRHNAKPAQHHHAAPVKAATGIVVSRCDYHDPAASVCGAVPPPDTCHLRDDGALQDPHCTPGAIDPRVTRANIDQTICITGYTDRVRPPTSYTSPLEEKLIHSYGLSITPSQSELDHLVSLELGGAPADPRNLWPEPYAGSRGSYDKDALENRLHSEVCDGQVSLKKAQSEITDWVHYQAPSSSPSHAPGGKESGSGGASTNTSPVAPATGSHCDPNYSGACLDPHASDYDCAGGGGDGPKYVQGPIRVDGTDHYQLDSNGDGVACS